MCKVLLDTRLPEDLRQTLTTFLTGQGHRVVTAGAHDLLVTCPDGVPEEKSLRADILCLADLSPAASTRLRDAGADYVRSPRASVEKIFQGVL